MRTQVVVTWGRGAWEGCLWGGGHRSAPWFAAGDVGVSVREVTEMCIFLSVCLFLQAQVKWWKIKWCFSFVSLSLFFLLRSLFNDRRTTHPFEKMWKLQKKHRGEGKQPWAPCHRSSLFTVSPGERAAQQLETGEKQPSVVSGGWVKPTWTWSAVSRVGGRPSLLVSRSCLLEKIRPFALKS